MDLAGQGCRLGPRLAWAAAAQASSSVTNFALYVGILVSTDTDGFGRWVAVLGVYHLALALSRSLVSEPLVSNDRPGATGETFSWGWAQRRYRLIGLGAALGVGLVGWLVDADPLAVAAVAVSLPALIGQDGFRNLAWARRRPGQAVGLDLFWLFVTGALLVGLVVTESARPVPIVLGWLAGGLSSALVGRRLVGDLMASDPAPNIEEAHVGAAATPGTASARPPGGERIGSADERRLHGRRHSHALLITARNLLPIAVATLIGPGAAGLLKAALIPFTPILTLFGGLRLVMLPAMQRAAEAGPSRDGHSVLDRFVGRLVVWYLVVAGSAAVVIIVAIETLAVRFDVALPVDSHVARWGGVVAVLTVVVRPLAEAIGFGRRPVAVVRWRLVEMAIEWTAVFAVASLVGVDQVVVGWAVGIALAALVWLRAGFRPSPVDRGRELSPVANRGRLNRT